MQLEAAQATNRELEFALDKQAEQMHTALKQAIREHQQQMETAWKDHA